MKNFHIYFVTNKTFTLEIIQKEEILTLTIILDKMKQKWSWRKLTFHIRVN